MKFSTVAGLFIALAIGADASCWGDCKKQCGTNFPYCNGECVGRCMTAWCPEQKPISNCGF